MGLGTTGILTQVSPGGYAALEIGVTSWLDVRLGGFLTYLGDQDFGAFSYPTDQNASVNSQFTTTLTAGRLDLCGARMVTGAVRARSCLGVMVGAFNTSAYVLVNEHKSKTTPWGAAALSAELTINLVEKLSLTIEADFVLPWWKRVIELDVVENDHVTETRQKILKPVGGMLGFGPVIRF
jgi:hypothetical protein